MLRRAVFHNLGNKPRALPFLSNISVQKIRTSSFTSVASTEEKLIKTPSMGESITEGTLTQWMKKVGDTVQRDEQVASIETDKIDVAVNCPESGIISHLFVREGDTVAVGGNLFKITLGPAASPTATKESAAAAPSKQEHLAPAMKSSSGSHGARIPLIKFLGASRKSKGHISQSPASTTSIVEPSAPKKDATLYQDGNRIIYESAEMLPKRYQTRPFSDMEMNLINHGGIYVS